MIGELLDAIAHCSEHPAESVVRTVRPYRAPQVTERSHQFLLMLKPELTRAASAADGAKLLGWVFSVLEEHGTEFGAARVLSGTRVRRHHWVESHYEMLNAISRHGMDRVSAAAGERLLRHRPEAAPDRVLGGHQFLERFPEFTARSLDVLAQNLPVTKFGAGTYATELMMDGLLWTVLNAFHPFQAAHFSAPGTCVVLVECTSEEPLREIRARAVGATDPVRAEPGSIRRELLERRPRWSGHWNVCTSLNAIHLSPGAIEGMFCVQRYFGGETQPLSLADTVLGARLLADGADADRLDALRTNPEVAVAGLRGPLFDITEDMPADDAADLVLRVLEQPGIRTRART
ncbi:hypothetical protein [Streptomyces spongiae]|uniref:Uncharacterized protein n=1 Tax=Streptomyces spongiae TaxID=565072 RepID=A0A5N8XDE5_9ACTN|nr:hypothetical protein [Streptomyces spongiae]MPY57511.1 hypothetical protein [Streptomyces spongiae]